jgi:hypothetical protein
MVAAMIALLKKLGRAGLRRMRALRGSSAASGGAEALTARFQRNREMARLVDERRQEIEAFTDRYRHIVTVNRLSQDFFRQLRFVNYFYRTEAFGEAVLPPPPPPPQTVSDELKRRFTLDGRIPFCEQYINDTYPSNHPLIYTEEEVSHYREMQRAGQAYIYGGLDGHLQQAFDRYPVAAKDVLVTGSITPWYEAMIIEHGGRPITVDYNPIITLGSDISTMQVGEDHGRVFERAVSISSFEHDGLGAYGDPLDPEGDLKAMRALARHVVPGGLVFFNVPCGPDLVMFNRARVYGPVRLPMILEGWERIDQFGFDDSCLTSPDASANPIFVLRKPC